MSVRNVGRISYNSSTGHDESHEDTRRDALMSAFPLRSLFPGLPKITSTSKGVKMHEGRIKRRALHHWVPRLRILR